MKILNEEILDKITFNDTVSETLMVIVKKQTIKSFLQKEKDIYIIENNVLYPDEEAIFMSLRFEEENKKFFEVTYNYIKGLIKDKEERYKKIVKDIERSGEYRVIIDKDKNNNLIYTFKTDNMYYSSSNLGYYQFLNLDYNINNILFTSNYISVINNKTMELMYDRESITFLEKLGFGKKIVK